MRARERAWDARLDNLQVSPPRYALAPRAPLDCYSAQGRRSAQRLER
jgi:hypothetical protein